jgi:hypothetical protein
VTPAISQKLNHYRFDLITASATALVEKAPRRHRQITDPALSSVAEMYAGVGAGDGMSLAPARPGRSVQAVQHRCWGSRHAPLFDASEEMRV